MPAARDAAVKQRGLFHCDTKFEASWRQVMKLSPDIKTKTHFNLNKTDFGLELQRFNRPQYRP